MNLVDIPTLTTAQMIEVDRAMIEDYHIELIQMMENAGRNLAHLARARFLGGDPRGKKIIILAGTGGNGGGALVCARRLHNWGAQVLVRTSSGESSGIPTQQLHILERMNVPIALNGYLPENLSVDLFVDGIIGYGLNGAPRGKAANLIIWANEHNAPTLSLDIPSGLDSTSGNIYEPAICATATMTLALPKQGLLNPQSAPYIGELYLADISVPPELYAKIGISVPPLFAEQDIIRIELQGA